MMQHKRVVTPEPWRGPHGDGFPDTKNGWCDDVDCRECNKSLHGDFQLANDPPPPTKATFENGSFTQLPLLSGLSCLPGQIDLFQVDRED